MSDAKKAAVVAAAAAAADTTEVAKKRKRAPPPPSQPKPKPKTIPREAYVEAYGAWVCTEHPTLSNGRQGIAISARSESEAHARVVEELKKRGLAVDKIALRRLEEGEVFLFQ